ncbi:unnamed protein product [Cladocopium goreaui]|uniref:Disrupted in renal carcinoma protein 2-like n=1 Tax=Cladocopium goreaui TaxID=2562237 RepID=A0A9P1DB79_9DINO|nr:unnamed protein product [Cladocopium goreaui]
MALKSGVFACLILALCVSCNNVMAQDHRAIQPPSVCPACPRSENLGKETEKSASSIVERTSENVGKETTEVTYPCDENAIEAVQQLCGNLVSALLVPICEWAADNKVTIPGMDGYLRGDTILLLAILIAVAIYFSTFSAPLRRTEVDQGNCVTADGEMAPRPRGPRAESKDS